MFHLLTPRLVLRQWLESDSKAFASLNADPQVMEHFPETLDAVQSDALLKRLSDHITKNAWGLWAVEEREAENFIGFTGINSNEDTPRGPAVEVGWRLARRFWGKGYATEAANAALFFAFEILNLSEVISFAALSNRRSQAVMQRLGMHEEPMTFMHPRVPEGSPLREHVLYAIAAKDFKTSIPVEIEKQA